MLRLPGEKNHLWLNKTGRISSPQQNFFKKLMKMEDYSLNCFAITGLNPADTFLHALNFIYMVSFADLHGIIYTCRYKYMPECLQSGI